jgi:hypothetical protein
MIQVVEVVSSLLPPWFLTETRRSDAWECIPSGPEVSHDAQEHTPGAGWEAIHGEPASRKLVVAGPPHDLMDITVAYPWFRHVQRLGHQPSPDDRVEGGQLGPGTQGQTLADIVPMNLDEDPDVMVTTEFTWFKQQTGFADEDRGLHE